MPLAAPNTGALCTSVHREVSMAGNSVKNKKKYRALKRKGMPKSRAAAISNAGKAASRRGGRNSSRKKK
jgi:hypothetical protein